MAFKLQLALLIISVLFFIYITRSIRKSKVKLDFTYFWIIFSIFLIVISAFPVIITKMTRLLGVDLDIHFLLVLIIFLLIYKCFTLSIQLSRLQERFENLVQSIALKENEAENNEKE